MDKEDALQNLKFTGRLFMMLGILALIGTALFWKTEERIIEIILKILSGIVMIYLSWLILSSRKVLA